MHIIIMSDPSSQGIQRGLLPLIEGTNISTKHGNVENDHILFIAVGALTQSNPSDLMTKLVGRLPIRVEFKPLKMGDLKEILTETKNNLIPQPLEPMTTESVTLEFPEAAVTKIANIAGAIKSTVGVIVASRLHVVI